LLFALDVHEEWELQARCRGRDATLFFGPNRFEPKRERLAREAAAKEICRGCPVLDACREFALGQEEIYGVWGGLGETDRRTVLAQRGGLHKRAG
jgi:WhiB family redox-sensing transcriptional regulator